MNAPSYDIDAAQNHTIHNQVCQDVLTPIPTAADQGTLAVPVDAHEPYIHAPELVGKFGPQQDQDPIHLGRPILQDKDKDEGLPANPGTQLFFDPSSTSTGQNRSFPSPWLMDAQEQSIHPLGETPVQSPLFLPPMQVPEVVISSPKQNQQQQQPADKPLDHEQDKVNNQVEEDCRDSGYTSGASVDGQSRRESASSSVSANMAESRYICTLDGNHLTYYMDKAQARVSSEKEEEEAKEEEVEGKEAECEKVEKEKVEEEEDDEDEDEDEDEEDTDGESILPWVTRKTLRSDFDVLSFAADYNSAIRARVAAKATAQAQAEPDLLRVNNLRRRYGGALMEVTSRAVKGSRPVFRPALDKGSTDDRYVSYIKYPNSLDDDEDDHEYVLRPNCHYHGRSHLHSHFLPQIPDTIRMPDRLPYILDQHGNQHPLPPTAPIPHPSTWTIQLGPNYTPVVNYEVFVTCDNCSHKFWLTSEEPDLLDLHQQEYCRTSGQKAFPSLLLLVDKWVGYGRAGKRHWKKVERRTRMQAYRLMSWSINRTMDVLMALLLWVQALRDGIDVEVDVDVGNACGLGEAVPGDIYGEDSSEKVVQAIGTWQARSRSQPQTSPLLSAPQEDGPEEDVQSDALESIEDALDEIERYR